MLHTIAVYVMLFKNIAKTCYVCFFFCMKKIQKIKLLRSSDGKKENQKVVEAAFWCDKVGAANGLSNAWNE